MTIHSFNILISDIQEMEQQATTIYDQLENHFPDDVIYEDRLNHSPGFRMNDAQFMGIPYSIIVGKSLKSQGQIELQIRKTGEKIYLAPSELIKYLTSKGNK